MVFPYMCSGYIFWTPYPLDLVAHPLDGIDQRADVTGHIIEKVDSGHWNNSEAQNQVFTACPYCKKELQQIMESCPMFGVIAV